MGQVFVEKEDVGRRERYFCLFPNDIIILSVGIELSGYCFEVLQWFVWLFAEMEFKEELVHM